MIHRAFGYVLSPTSLIYCITIMNIVINEVLLIIEITYVLRFSNTVSITPTYFKNMSREHCCGHVPVQSSIQLVVSVRWHFAAAWWFHSEEFFLANFNIGLLKQEVILFKSSWHYLKQKYVYLWRNMPFGKGFACLSVNPKKTFTINKWHFSV